MAALNLPNLLTLSRLLGIPVVVWLLLAGFPGHDWWAAVAFLVLSATDTLDGRIARRFGTVTELGKFLDPLADKLFILAVLAMLVQAGVLAAWIVVVIFGRELLITLLRSVSLGQGRVIAASGWGKTKTVSQVVAITLLIVSPDYSAVRIVAYPAIWLAVAITVYSGLDYLWKFRYVLGLPPLRPAIQPLPTGGGAPAPGEEAGELAEKVAAALGGSRQTIAAAESATGGLLAAALTERPGSSDHFLGGIVAYSPALKHRLLGVPEDVLEARGAVSPEVAIAMAEGARERLGSDYAISVTGISGPDGDGTAKPVGLHFIGIAGPDLVLVKQFNFNGGRLENRRLAVAAALKLLLESLGEVKA